MDDDVDLTMVPDGWTVLDGRLHRAWEFADFAEAWAFMVRVAAECERLDHHPDWSNSWNRVAIDLVSHDAGTITQRDLDLAVAIDRCASAGPTTCS